VYYRFKVRDESGKFQKDRLIGWACTRLDRFAQGLQLIQLRGEDAMYNGAFLLIDSQLSEKI